MPRQFFIVPPMTSSDEAIFEAYARRVVALAEANIEAQRAASDP